MRAIPALLFFFLFTVALVKASPPPLEAVLDTSGEKVRPGNSYFIIPYLKTQGDGLGMGSFGYDTTTCPRIVVPMPFNTKTALPVKFMPSNPKHHVVYTSRNLNIKFNPSPRPGDSPCENEESRVWRMTKFISEGLHIGTNGEVGNHDFTAIYNWFKIEKAQGYNNAYIFTFCPKSGVVTCNDIGFFNYGGRKYLGISNPHDFQSFPVVFSKFNGHSVMTS